MLGESKFMLDRRGGGGPGASGAGKKKRVRLRMWESLSVRRLLIWLAVLSVVLHSALAIKLASRAPI